MLIRDVMRFIPGTVSTRGGAPVRISEKKIFLSWTPHVHSGTKRFHRQCSREPTQEPTLDNEIRTKEQRYTLTYNRMLKKLGIPSATGTGSFKNVFYNKNRTSWAGRYASRIILPTDPPVRRMIWVVSSQSKCPFGKLYALHDKITELHVAKVFVNPFK